MSIAGRPGHMLLARRRRAAVLVALSGLLTIALAPSVAADPNGDSAAKVIDRFRQQGYAVQVNGSPAGDTSLLMTCTVTSVDKPSGPSPDPATTTINVGVACPLNHA